MRTAFVTIAAKRELPYARVLARSFAEHHSHVPFFVLLADEIEGCFDPTAEQFELLTLAELRVTEPERFRFHYKRQPLSYAATPYVLSALLERGFDKVVFVKQESLVLRDQGPVLRALDENAIVLTPHLLSPPDAGDPAARELNILQSGVYNGGLIGVRAGVTARRFLAWWEDRAFSHCRHAIGEGMHYEQRWLDLVPAYFRDVCLLRDPGSNVGHWNLPERLTHAPRLFRFSGFDPDRPDEVTRYSQRVGMRELGDAAGLFGSYVQALQGAGWDEAQRWPYAFGRFVNGVPIPDFARELYSALGDEVRRFNDPFQTGPGSFYAWLNEPVDPARKVTRLWRAVYERRRDLQEALPDPYGADNDAFASWTASSGVTEHDIDPAFVLASSS